jgi:type IV secretory pathway protease TraF
VNSRLIPHSRALERDRKGRPLPHLARGEHLVPPGRFWLLAPHDLSFDSRYIGEGDAANVTARISPLWTATRAKLFPSTK